MGLIMSKSIKILRKIIGGKLGGRRKLFRNKMNEDKKKMSESKVEQETRIEKKSKIKM